MAEADNTDSTEKTEDPSQKRLDEALKRGDVVKSQEVSTWFIIAGATLVLMTFSDGMSSQLAATLRGLVANAHAIDMDGPALPRLFQKIGAEMIAAMAIPFLLLMLAALGGNLIQHKLVWSLEALAPQFSKVSPAAGFKRLFSKQALANLAKGLIKMVLVGGVLTVLMWPERGRIMALERTDPAAVMPLAQTLALKLLGAVVAMGTVVITDPTHYAVALKYERGMEAPICVAKGVEALALKIREVAGEHSIPIVENPPLARALHATVEVDQPIPVEHYKAVAEVIGYIMRLRRAVPR